VIDTADTIVAIASPATPAARGVVRISGDDTGQVLRRVDVRLPASRRANRMTVKIDLGQPLGTISTDILYWPTERSYCGQPSAEIHTIGSLPILSAITDALVAAGGRVARPGEFTMRAFLAGRLDLTQAEAVLGVIDAETHQTLSRALDQLAGNLGRPLNQVRGELLDLLADVEAGLDFVEEDIEFVTEAELTSRLNSTKARLDEIGGTMQGRGGGAQCDVIALRGEPNAGKSSLLNRVAGHNAAIVADVAGTTRDVVMADVFINGHSAQLVDTAGIDSANSPIAIEAQRQAERTTARATLRIWCVDYSRKDFPQGVADCNAMIAQAASPVITDLRIATKSDLSNRHAVPDGWICCSAVTGTGIDTLRKRIAEILAAKETGESNSVIGTAARAGESVRNARAAIAKAIELTENRAGDEFVATELRLAASAIGEVTGEVYTDDILDRVFSRFCIGK